MNIKMKVLVIMIAASFVISTAHSQSISPISAQRVGGGICPGNASYYASAPNGQSGCTFSWSIVNGSIISQSGNQVNVKWGDVPGAIGELTVTMTCLVANQSVTSKATTKETIISINNLDFGYYSNHVDIDYCNTREVLIYVPPMYVPNTGGIAQPARVEADYLWNIPDGWEEVGSGRKGQFGTSLSQIKIRPTGCAKPGQVTVQGTLADARLCSESAMSKIARITLGGVGGSLIVLPQGGYSGSYACNRDPVTFSANLNVNCPVSYQWEIPNSWTEEDRGGNWIRLKPSGTSADEADIKATVTLACGSTLANTYKPIFNKPSIVSPAAICFGSNTVTLANTGPNVNVVWQTSANMVVSSGQGTPTALIRASAENIHGNGWIRATIGCAAVEVPQKSVWVGKPNMAISLNNGQLISYDATTVNEVCKLVDYRTVSDLSGSVSNTWERIAANPTNTTWSQNGNNIQFYLWAQNQTATFRLTSSNSCGTKKYDFRFKAITCSSSPCNVVQVWPNPARSELAIAVPNIPAPCDKMQLNSIEEKNAGLRINSEPEKITSVELMTLDGKLVYEKKGSEIRDKTTVDLSGVKAGLYILNISLGDRTETHRVQVND